ERQHIVPAVLREPEGLRCRFPARVVEDGRPGELLVGRLVADGARHLEPRSGRGWIALAEDGDAQLAAVGVRQVVDGLATGAEALLRHRPHERDALARERRAVGEHLGDGRGARWHREQPEHESRAQPGQHRCVLYRRPSGTRKPARVDGGKLRLIGADSLMHPRRPALLARLVALAALLLVPFAGRTSAAVDSDLASATNGGGCHPTGLTPSLLDMLTLIDPEWAPVVAGTTVDSAPVVVHGEVESMHGDTSGDFPSTHLRADVVHVLRLDAADEELLGTGNGDEFQTEWEAGVDPAWAWAGPGDRM